MTPLLTAFFELSSCRQMSMSLGPIPWTAIVEYADRLGWDRDLSRFLVEVIHELDRAFLSWHDKGSKASAPAKGDPDAKKPTMRQRRA